MKYYIYNEFSSSFSRLLKYENNNYYEIFAKSTNLTNKTNKWFESHHTKIIIKNKSILKPITWEKFYEDLFMEQL